MKPLIKATGLESSISKEFDKRQIWYRRFWGAYYMFEFEYETGVVYVYKNMYNPQHWQDEWTQVHRFELSEHYRGL